jgi:hypothetical protein
MTYVSRAIHFTFAVAIILIGFLFWGAVNDGFRTTAWGDHVIVLRYKNPPPEAP